MFFYPVLMLLVVMTCLNVDFIKTCIVHVQIVS